MLGTGLVVSRCLLLFQRSLPLIEVLLELRSRLYSQHALPRVNIFPRGNIINLPEE